MPMMLLTLQTDTGSVTTFTPVWPPVGAVVSVTPAGPGGRGAAQTRHFRITEPGSVSIDESREAERYDSHVPGPHVELFIPAVEV